jgi:hypothetical protein
LHDIEGQYQSQRAQAGSTGFDPLRMGGSVATSLMAPGVGAASKGGILAQGLRAAGTGAAYNVAQTVTDAQPGGSENYALEKGKQALTGAVAGPIAAAGGSVIARAIRPNTGAAQQALIDNGVTLTPGDILGGGFKRVEDGMTSWPVVGDLIRNAKNRSFGDLNTAAYNRATNPVGVDASKFPVGPEGVAMVKSTLSDAYDKLLPNLTFDVKTIQPELDQLRQLASEMPATEAQQFNNVLDRNLGQLSAGKADGITFKKITSDLGAQAKNFGGATDGYQRDLGTALGQAQSLFRQGLSRSNPEQAAQLAKIDQGYANYAIIRNASQSAGDKSNGFTPAQLAAAVRASDDTVGNGATATGTALMQDLSNPARQILPSQVADSGTPFRSALQVAKNALIGGVGAMATGHGDLMASIGSALAIPTALGGAAMTLPYTKLGQAAMQKILAERPEYAASLAAMLRKGAPLAGAASVPALTNGS